MKTHTTGIDKMAIDVIVSEVGPRDGLQSIDQLLDLETKKRWITAEAAAGVTEIEVGSFVNYRLLPQMSDTAFTKQRATHSPANA